MPNSRKDLDGICTSKGAQRFKGRRSFCPPSHWSWLTGSHGDKARGCNVGRRGFGTRTSPWLSVSGAWHNWLPFPKPPLTSSRVLTLGPQTLKGPMLEFKASLNWVSRKVYHVFVVVTDLELQLSIPFHYDCR